MQTEHVEQQSADSTQNQQLMQEELNQAKAWLEHFARLYQFAGERADRCEKLMKRKAAKTWKPEKVSKMVRRLMNAKKDQKTAEENLNKIADQLRALGVEVTIESASKVASLSS